MEWEISAFWFVQKIRGYLPWHLRGLEIARHLAGAPAGATKGEFPSNPLLSNICTLYSVAELMNALLPMNTQCPQGPSWCNTYERKNYNWKKKNVPFEKTIYFYWPPFFLLLNKCLFLISYWYHSTKG